MKHWVLIKWLDEQLQPQHAWVEAEGESPLLVTESVLAQYGDRLGLTFVQSCPQIASVSFTDEEIEIVVERVERERASAERAVEKTKPEPKTKRRAAAK